MDECESKERTRDAALRVIRMVDAPPKSTGTSVIGKQLLRSGPSIGANYLSACRSKSTADIIANWMWNKRLTKLYIGLIRSQLPECSPQTVLPRWKKK